MTLDDFLTDYVPRVLRPMGGWEVRYGIVRRDGISCPLTAESELGAGNWEWEAYRLGLSREDAIVIADAADVTTTDLLPEGRPIRARLLAGLGLEEQA